MSDRFMIEQGRLMLTAIAWAAQQGLPAVVVPDANARFGRSRMLWSSAATPH